MALCVDFRPVGIIMSKQICTLWKTKKWIRIRHQHLINFSKIIIQLTFGTIGSARIRWTCIRNKIDGLP